MQGLRTGSGEIHVLAALLIVGALLRREYAQAGQWVSVAAVAFYLLGQAWDRLRDTIRFRRIPVRERLRVLIFFVLLYLTVKNAVTGAFAYFPVLALLAADYLLTEPEPRK